MAVHNHTPERTAKNLAEINKKCKIEFRDVSYSNDCVDSLFNDYWDITVYLPNSDEEDHDQELWNNFKVTYYFDGDEEEKEFANLDEAIKFIHTLI